MVGLVDTDRDTWITQATFTAANRRAVNVRDVGLLFADLDTYRTPGLADKTPEEQAALLAIYCRQEGLPAPSIVLFSGRGLQAKWLLVEAVEPAGLTEWNHVQLALVRLLEPFSADVAARDVSRVLRLDRTINAKNGERCRVVWTASGIEGCPARYDFTDLWAVLGDRVTAEKPREERRKAADRHVLALPPTINLRRLNWYRLYDLRDLWSLRGGVPEGFRELTLFWQLNFLLWAEPGAVGDVWKEAQALAAQIAPGEHFYEPSGLSTVYRRAQEQRLYTPRNTYLLDLFQIEPEEERSLRTIISRREKYRRQVEKRRAAGVAPRVDLSGKPWEALGVSRRWWFELRRRGAL